MKLNALMSAIGREDNVSRKNKKRNKKDNSNDSYLTRSGYFDEPNTSPTKWNGHSYSGYLKPSCSHKGTTPVFTINNSNICALSRLNLISPGDFDLLIDCSNYLSDYLPMHLPEGYKHLAKHEQRYHNVMAIPWSDMSEPSVNVQFWIDLVETLRSINKPHRVGVFCVGSHGRTGTALSALLMASQNMRAIDAVEFVRRNHCTKAVESTIQLYYLCNLEEALFGDCTSDPDKMRSIAKPAYKGAITYPRDYHPSGLDYASESAGYNEDNKDNPYADDDLTILIPE